MAIADEESFVEFARSRTDRLLELAWLVTRDPEDARDAVQDALGTRWALGTLAPGDMPLVPYFTAVQKAKDHEASMVSAADQEKWWGNREAFLVQCMDARGFDYFPQPRTDRDPGTEVAVREAQRYQDTLPVPALDADRGVVAAVGYGLSSTSDEQWRQLTRPIDDTRNAEYLASLSPAQQDRYEIAMSGQTHDDPRINPMTKGCYWEVERKYPDPAGTPARESLVSVRFADVIVALLGFKDEEDPPIEADPRLVALNAEWRTCMAQAGLSTEGLRAHQTTGAGRFDGPGGAIALAGLTGDDGTVADYPAPDDAPADQRSLTGSAPEIRIALADYDCRRASGYETRLVAVQREFEAQFVKAHQKRLDALLAHVEKSVP